MDVLIAFSPFLLFALTCFLSPSLALWLAFAAAFAVTIRDFVESPSLRALDAAHLALFGTLALFTGLLWQNAPLQAVRLAAELPLFLIAFVSIARGRPLTAAYSGSRSLAGAGRTAVLRLHLWVTSAWALAWLVMAMADASFLADPRLPAGGLTLTGLAVLGMAASVTLLVPTWLEGRAQAPQSNLKAAERSNT